jgi:hypothetical protein
VALDLHIHRGDPGGALGGQLGVDPLDRGEELHHVTGVQPVQRQVAELIRAISSLGFAPALAVS